MKLTYAKRTTAPTNGEITEIFAAAGFTTGRIYRVKQYEEQLDYVSVWSKETDRSDFPLFTLVYDELHTLMHTTDQSTNPKNLAL